MYSKPAAAAAAALKSAPAPGTRDERAEKLFVKADWVAAALTALLNLLGDNIIGAPNVGDRKGDVNDMGVKSRGVSTEKSTFRLLSLSKNASERTRLTCRPSVS